MRGALVLLGALGLAAGAAVGAYFVIKSNSQEEVARLVDEAIEPSCGRYESVSVEPLSRQVQIRGLVLECFGAPGTRLTADLASVSGGKPENIATIFDVENAPEEPLYEFLPAIDRVTLRSVTLGANGEETRFEQAELTGLAMRRLPRPPVMQNGGPPYTADETVSLLAYHTRFDQLAIDGVETENTLSGETATAESVTLEAFNAGSIDVVELVGLSVTIANAKLRAIDAELLLVSDFDAGGFVQGKVSEAQAGDAPYIAPQELPSPTIGNTLIEGLELELEESVALVDQLKLSDLVYVGSIAVGGRVDMLGFEVELAQSHSEFLRKLGYRRFVMNLNYETEYDDEKKTWKLIGLNAVAQDMGKLEADASLVGIHLAPTQDRIVLGGGLSGQLMTAVIDRTALEGARIAYTDQGFVKKLVEIGAAEAEVPAEIYAEQLMAPIDQLMEVQGIPREPFEPALSEIRRFLQDPGSLEIKVAPDAPLDIVELPQQFFFGPAKAVEILNLEVTAR